MAGEGEDIMRRVKPVASRLMEKQAMEGTASPEEQHRATASIYCVSRVPDQLRGKNSKDYTPVFVAIGPIHHYDKELSWGHGERLKASYLNRLISRGHSDPANHLAVIEGYVRVVTARENEARAMYAREEIRHFHSDKFIEMMVVDGCFIIQHLVTVALGHDHEDPSLARKLCVDLILAENQMPFFVLVDLIARTKLPELENLGYAPSVLLVKLVLFFLAGEKGRDFSEALPAADGVSHILHLLHELITKARTMSMWEAPSSRVLEGGRAQAARRLLCRLPSLLAGAATAPDSPRGPQERCVAAGERGIGKRHEARMGLHFKMAHGGSGSKPVASIASVMGQVPLAVMLHENKLRLPRLLLDFRTARLLLNLMAFEQSPRGDSSVSRPPQDVSSYVAFMAKLVQSAEDARLLAEAQVVQQQHGGLDNESMEEMARFFRMVGMANESPDLLYRGYLRKTLHLLRTWTYNWVDVDRNYFTFLAEILAVVTFVSSVATIFQTYAAFKYH